MLDRALDLIERLTIAPEGHNLASSAKELGLATSTAHRLAARLVARGYMVRTGKGRYAVGPTLIRLAQDADVSDAIVAAGLDPIRALARSKSATVHLGVWSADMVNYVAKARGGGPKLYTRAGMSQEGYCSAMGKVLLAAMPQAARAAYTTTGEFIALTDRTVIDPEALSKIIEQAARDDYAVDDGEILDDLRCVAVPVRDGTGTVIAAISLSFPRTDEAVQTVVERHCPALRTCAEAIGKRIAPDAKVFI